MGASQVALVVNNLLPEQEIQDTQVTQFRSLGWEDAPGIGNGTALQDSCLENSMNRGA